MFLIKFYAKINIMFIELEVKTAIIVHGFDNQNNEIQEHVNESGFMKKIIAIERIKSISEKYLLVTSSHGRIMYWEYKGSIDEIKQKFVDLKIPVV